MKKKDCNQRQSIQLNKINHSSLSTLVHKSHITKSTFYFQFIPFTWRETELFSREVKIQTSKSTLII